MSYLDTLAGFVATCRFDDLPPAVVEQARYVIADTLAAIAAGSAEPEMTALTARMSEGETGAATVIGASRRVTPRTAALLNGTAGTFLEMDEGNRFSRGHPSIHVLPAALAYAEAHGLSGRELLTALVLGYEVGSRLGGAARLRADMHPHGTWGTVAAVAAVSRLAGCDAKAVREAINVSSSLTLATSKRTMLEGGTVRNTYAGVSNQMGLFAVELVQSGFTGERDGLASVFGRVVSESLDTDALTRRLGDDWQITQNYFKRHGCCRYNHGTLDALLQALANRPGLRADDVAAVDVVTYGYAAELDDQSPQNTLAAKFSVPFAVATTIVNRSSGMASFTMEAVRDPRVQALAKQVSVREDPALSAMLPMHRPARVAVRLASGETLAGEVRTNRGDDADPYSRTELDDKFHELTQRIWRREVAGRLHAQLHALETLADLRELSATLRQAAQR